jgi:hypothetical protein
MIDQGASGIASAPTRSGLRATIHRLCGQLCGQLLRDRREGAWNLVIGWIAENLSNGKPLKINHLHQHDEAVTVIPQFQPACLLAVEFSGRASIGFARG